MKPQHEIRKTLNFESAHFLPKLPTDHPCSRTHGHSYKVTICVRGDLDPAFGWVMDFSILKRAAAPLIQMLDHRLLNDVSGLENPTSEVLGLWFYERLKRDIPDLHQIIISETCSSESHYPASAQ